MKQTIFRNIAIVSAIFILAFSIMLITNYFQVSGADTLQAQAIETLKKLNDENADNPELREQIRELDLLARKAYFISHAHLMTGVYILIAMFVVFVVSTRLYFAKHKNIPDKQIDPIDDWAVKTLARKYVLWIAGALIAVALLFVVLSSPYLKKSEIDKQSEQIANATPQSDEQENIEEEQPADIEAKQDTINLVDTTANVADKVETDSVKTPEIEISKITHNAFRGNNSNGITAAKKVPTDWDLKSGKNIAWKAKVPKGGYNSPVINGNKVFISGADNASRELYCYELSSGNLLWTLAAKNIPGSPATMPKVNDDTGLAASTVATNGKQVCAIFATGDVICADMDGKQLWAKNLGVPDNHYGYASSLLTFGNLLIIQYDNVKSPRVLALDLATGAERWSKARTDKVSWGSPTIAYIDKKPQLIVLGTPAITSYNPNNGEQLWRVEGMTGEVGASPCSANGVVYAASEYSALIAVNAVDGSTLWKVDDYLPEVSSPVATKDNVFVVTSYGVVACYDAKTGELGKFHELSTEFYSSPVIAEGRLYLFSNSGKMYIFTANADCKLIKSFDTGEKTFATPAFTDGKIVVRTEGSIYCVAAK